MRTAVLGASRTAMVPEGVERLRGPEELGGVFWDVLALTAAGCALLEPAGAVPCACGTLLVPGDRSGLARRLRAEQVVSCGFSPRDSLTFSSLEEDRAVLCVQRALARPDGGRVEPREVPLERTGGQPPEELLLLGGLRLLLG